MRMTEQELEAYIRQYTELEKRMYEKAGFRKNYSNEKSTCKQVYMHDTKKRQKLC